MILKRLSALAIAGALSPGWALAQTSPLTGPHGGTNNAFMQFTGPASSLKTFTLPNISDTISTLNSIQTYLAAKTFNSGTFILAGSSSGTTTVNAAAVASGILTLPAATDTLVGRTTTDTLTNKTLTSPAITTPTGIVKGDVGLGNVDNTSDATKNAASATLTNKTIDTAGPNTVKVNGNTLAASVGSATVTLPNSTDTLVGRATTDTLTNKTVDTASNTFKLNGASFGTAAQATAALNAVVGDSGSGGTKGLVPAPGSGDAAAGKYLKADGTFAVPPGSGGSGATDSERQNSLLVMIYQSKSFVGYRRLFNLFADGYKASDGVNAGSSTNYTVDTSTGLIKPTTTAGVDQIPTMTGLTTPSGTASAFSTTTGGEAWKAMDASNSTIWQSTAVPSGGTPQWLQYQLTGAVTAATYSIQGYNSSTSTPNSSTFARSVKTWTLQGSNNGSTFTTIDTQTNITNWTDGLTQTFTIGSPGSYSYYRLSITANNGDASFVSVVQFQITTASVTNNMTEVTTTQTTDSSVSSGRALIEYDPNGSSPTLNTDITIDVTCDGGSHWAAASLSSVTANSQGGRSVAETTDTACTSGTSAAARLKSLNNKAVRFYGLSLTVH